LAWQNSRRDSASGIAILYLAYSPGRNVAVELKIGIGDLLEPANLHLLETEILPTYLKSRRWFASKDQDIQSTRLSRADMVSFENEVLLFCEVEVELPARTECYQLPLGLLKADHPETVVADSLKLVDVTLAGDQVAVTDAFALDTLATGLLNAMKANDVLKISNGEIHCSSLVGFAEELPGPEASVKRLSAEQSNSSLVFGASMIMKLIRRVMHGVNPEVEMIRYLTKHQYAHTPPLLGEVQHLGENGSSYSMYVVQKFIANQGDAWSYTLDALSKPRSERGYYQNFAAAIGTRLAELHEILSGPTEDRAFAPLEASPQDVEGWAISAQRQLLSAFAVLEDNKDLSGEFFKKKVAVIERRDAILASVADLARSGIGSLMTRIHGDFHLGQVLVSDSDAFIIDFEGEPSKPLEVRRGKSSPMRDVAGLLRSLSYAEGASGVAGGGFAQEMSDVFLGAYQDVLDRAPRRWVANQYQQLGLLDLFLMEKCAYEICYEAANRPAWLTIPLGGFAEIISRLFPSPEMTNA
jgi:maltose alpha-D-glucosyltransferase/alpha-amylase